MSKLEELINELCSDGVKYKKLGEMFNTYSGLKGKSKNDFVDGNCRYITYMNIYKNLDIDQNTNDFVKVDINEKQNYIQLGDLLVAGSSENIEDSGMVSVVCTEPKENIALNSFCFGMRPTEEYKNILNPDYCKYVMRCKTVRNLIKSCSFGVTRYNLKKDKFLNLEIPVPPLPIQEEIVRILDSFTELTARKKQYEYYRDELIEKAGGRNSKLIDMLVQPVTDGPHTTPELFPSGVPFVSATAIYNGKVHLSEAKGFISYEFDKECSKKYKPARNDVFMVKSGSTTGKVAFVDFDESFNVWSPIAAMRTNKDNLPRFLYHLLRTSKVQEQVLERMSHGSQPNLSMRVIEKFDVCVPHISEQQRIVDILDRFDTLCNDITAGLPAEIEARQKQYEYYRDKLLTFKRLEVNK